MMRTVEPGEMNLTLAAFYGPKPDPLTRLLEALQIALHTELGTAFSAYAIEQVHATIIGLEGWRFGVEAFNLNMVQATGESSAMDLRGLFQFIQEMSPFHIRIGGYSASSLYPFTSRGLHPYIRSFALNRSSAVVVGWPVIGESYPMTLDLLRKDCRHYNVLHKYHQNEKDVDNDLFLVLGWLHPDEVSDEKAERVQETLRQLLAGRAPLDLLIRPEDISVVAYTDSQLPIAGSLRYSLGKALSRLNELQLLYRNGFPVPYQKG